MPKPGKSHLLASVVERGRVTFGLRCAGVLACAVQASPYSLLPGPLLHSGERRGGRQNALSAVTVVPRAGGSTLALAESAHCVCCHDWRTGLFPSLGLSILNCERLRPVLTSSEPPSGVGRHGGLSSLRRDPSFQPLDALRWSSLNGTGH